MLLTMTSLPEEWRITSTGLAGRPEPARRERPSHFTRRRMPGGPRSLSQF